MAIENERSYGLKHRFILPGKIWKVLIALLLSVLVLYVAVGLIRFNNAVEAQQPLADYNSVLEVNSGKLDVNAIGVYPRSESVVMASNGKTVFFASRIRQEIGMVDANLTRDSVNFSDFANLGVPKEPGWWEFTETYIFDLEMGNNELFVSLVSTDRNKLTCDNYFVLGFPIDRDGNLGEAKRVWKSSYCTSVVSDAYYWPDFTGRLAFDGSDYLYMSTGASTMNVRIESYPEAEITGQAATIQEETIRNPLFGSITKIDLRTGLSTRFAKGFRSPAGIAVAMNPAESDKVGLWVVDHGPRGGDELNYVTIDEHYGWPWVSLGSSYGKSDLSNSPTEYKTHVGFAPPVFTWNTAIAPSQLQHFESGFELLGWNRGHILLGSLKTEALFVLDVSQGKVIAVEEFPVSHRVRDLATMPEEFFISTDDGMLLSFRVSEDQEISPGPYPLGPGGNSMVVDLILYATQWFVEMAG